MRFLTRNGLTLLIIITFIAGCQPSHKEKVKTTVKEHLKNEAGENAKYNPNNFGKVDSVFLSVEETDKHKQLSDTMTLLGKIDGMDLRVKGALNPEERDSLQQELNKLRENLRKRRKLIDEYVTNYEPRLVGYSIPHSYKLNDSSYDQTFIVDTTYTVDSSYATKK